MIIAKSLYGLPRAKWRRIDAMLRKVLGLAVHGFGITHLRTTYSASSAPGGGDG